MMERRVLLLLLLLTGRLLLDEGTYTSALQATVTSGRVTSQPDPQPKYGSTTSSNLTGSEVMRATTVESSLGEESGLTATLMRTPRPDTASPAGSSGHTASPLPVSSTPSPHAAQTAPRTPAHFPAASPRRDSPSELNVGDEESPQDSPRASSPLDPVLAGLVSIFIVCTAVVSVLLVLRFRHRNVRPEFHRLHDLPMDDLLEDTPLSSCSY
ncbi:putative protein TPRXL [Denticeps clupeoides]|uniref:putative protein TPRXL n=1 Tax=Denticeps clupeoides TaxID=299321 RepID=UPI0010A4E040|nr:putative protein TPRXL [Denticeps clupeoides]